jgi:hypothetical protein
MLNVRVLSLVAAILLASITPSRALGAIAGVEWSGSAFVTSDGPFSMGYLFQATTNLQVVGLGAFDFLGDGLATSHQVGLWTSAGTLIASTTVQSGTASTLQGHFRYESIASPVTLTTGMTYVVGAANFGPEDPWATNTQGAFSAPGITYLQDRFLGFTNSFVMPTRTLERELSLAGSFGGNILLAEQPVAEVPEPASLVVWGLAGLGCAIGGYRRRKRA